MNNHQKFTILLTGAINIKHTPFAKPVPKKIRLNEYINSISYMLKKHQNFNFVYVDSSNYNLKSKNPEIWKHLAKWYGLQETSLGLASVTELIHNNGQIAETLEHYLLNKGLTEEIKNSLKSFEYWLKEHLVLTKNLLPHNLVLKNGNDELIIKIVDGIGCHSFIPLPQNLNFFAKIYVNKRIKLMWQRIHWDLSGREGMWK